jgi:hypothetical protein
MLTPRAVFVYNLQKEGRKAGRRMVQLGHAFVRSLVMRNKTIKIGAQTKSRILFVVKT